MAKSAAVVVLCDATDEAATRNLLGDSHSDWSVVPLANGPALHRRVREAVSTNRGAAFVNFCLGTAEDEARADAAQVSHLLESLGVCFVGCRPTTQSHSRSVLRMMVFYANVPQTSFVEIEDTARDIPLIRQLALPVIVESSDVDDGAWLVAAATYEAADAAVNEGLQLHSKLLVSEQIENNTAAFTSSFVVVATGRNKSRIGHITKDFPKAGEYGQSIASSVLNNCGFCVVDVAGDEASPRVTRLRAGCTCVDLGRDAIGVIEALVPAAREQWIAAQRNYVVTFDPTDKGYHLRAARAVKKGEIVFGDEARSFSIVTKPFVDANWDDELKLIFSRYAWPLDTEGHVYAIWEDDPKRWRPINHSCDPNCINAAPHSLNVIAARDIAKGEDLAMDYSTFCDFTMKPFQCLCGSTTCRGEIKIEARHLIKYGQNAWLRKAPAGPSDVGASS